MSATTETANYAYTYVWAADGGRYWDCQRDGYCARGRTREEARAAVDEMVRRDREESLGWIEIAD